MEQVRGTRVLIIEDSEVDALLVTRELEKADLHPIVTMVEKLPELRRALGEKQFDVVISDFILPHFNGMDALAAVRERSEELPFVLVSGRIGEEQAAEAIRNGANDYLMKANLSRLGLVTKRALAEGQIKLERRNAQEELERSNQELKLRSDQLTESNRTLASEVEERRKAQVELSLSKEHLRRVIDSAPELIFSVDRTLRVSTWNRSLRDLTRFSEREVLNRSLEKLPAFSAAPELLQSLRTVGLPGTLEFTITTKDQVKKVVQVNSSLLQGEKGEDQGMLFIGRDITPNVEEHGRLIDGMGYLVQDRSVRSSVELFLSLVRLGRKGMLITRANPGLVSSWLSPDLPVEVVELSVRSIRGDDESSLAATQDVIDNAVRFTSADSPSIVLLDGGHYLVATLGFSRFLDAVFQLTEALASRQAILLVRIDPNLFDEERLAFLENELLPLPSQRLEDVTIEDEAYALLRYLHEQTQNNALVPLKKISAHFDISHVTVAKRIDRLEQEGLIFVRKVGKQRAPYLTEKGRTLLAKRRTA